MANERHSYDGTPEPGFYDSVYAATANYMTTQGGVTRFDLPLFIKHHPNLKNTKFEKIVKAAALSHRYLNRS